jgi:ferredoxin-type protein NapH
MEKNSTIYLQLLKTTLGTYINWVWLVYENWIKTTFVLIGSFLTIKIIGSSKRTTMRKTNLIGFIIAALTVHVATPLLVEKL